MLRIDVDTDNSVLSVELAGSTESLVKDFAVSVSAVYAAMRQKDALEADVFRRHVSLALGNFDSRTWEVILKASDLMVEGGYGNFLSDS